ncbi:unnamed protein product [Adineta steineri]|uniref:FAD-binding domain-containing protein n=3 Tax=Adineta steineri TaxID=433720 RepID=A0A818U8K6_9BILA|nr:unnamed protein product [Adineta steineri]
MEEECPQIVIIGGGPVGLFTAIQIKILVPQLNLVIYEKHVEYQRKHVLRLNKVATFFGFPSHPLLTNLIDNLPSVVRTSVLESQLLELAKKLGIPIKYENIINLDKFINAQMIIGADGSHSTVRQLVFNNKMKVQNILKYVIEIKYEVYGHGEKLDFIKYQYRTQKQFKYFIQEHIGSEKDNRTPITIHLLVDQHTYEQMKSATFKQPYYLHTHQHLIPNDLLDTITIWLNVKKEYADEKRVEHSERITSVALMIYQSAEVVHYQQDKQQQYNTCLVGDAAFGVPFFRSLNNGIICSRKLASCIQLYYGNKSTQTGGGNILNNLKFGWTKLVNQAHCLLNSNEPLKAYSQFVHLMATKEIMIAQNKANFLFAADMMNKINGSVPWQLNKWSSEDVDHLKETIYSNNQSITTTDDQIDSNTWEDEDYDLVQEFDILESDLSNNFQQD